jgi:hypothetical protein
MNQVERLIMTFTRSRALYLLAFVFALLDTLIVGGVISASGLQWLLPAAITTLILALGLL